MHFYLYILREGSVTWRLSVRRVKPSARSEQKEEQEQQEALEKSKIWESRSLEGCLNNNSPIKAAKPLLFETNVLLA